jgi:hypothetical protein
MGAMLMGASCVTATFTWVDLSLRFWSAREYQNVNAAPKVAPERSCNATLAGVALVRPKNPMNPSAIALRGPFRPCIRCAQ